VKINIIGFDISRDLIRVETRAFRGTDAVNKYSKDSNIDLYWGVESRGPFYIRLKASLIYNVVNIENNISIRKLFSGDNISGLRRVARVLLKAFDDLFWWDSL
jgi:hypothetical protein